MNIKKTLVRIRNMPTAFEQYLEEQERIERARLPVPLRDKKHRFWLFFFLLFVLPNAIAFTYFWEVFGDRYIAQMKYRDALELECARSLAALRQADGRQGLGAQFCRHSTPKSCVLFFHFDPADETCAH